MLKFSYWLNLIASWLLVSMFARALFWVAADESSNTCSASGLASPSLPCIEDTKGFPAIMEATPQSMTEMSSEPLYLSGVGMRRKNFYIAQVDVYLIGFSLSTMSINQAAAWVRSVDQVDKATLGSFSDALLEGTSDLPGSRIAVSKRFVRAVSKKLVVEAFNDAFKGCNEIEIARFKEGLGSALGSAGAANGDEITYYWLNGGGLIISFKGEVMTHFRGEEIEKRLLEVYVEESRTVSPELVKNLRETLARIQS